MYGDDGGVLSFLFFRKKEKEIQKEKTGYIRFLCFLINGRCLFVRAVKYGARARIRAVSAFAAFLECVSKREIRKFEWIFRQFKE